MRLYSLETSLVLPRRIDEVFAFFSDAANLPRITPESLAFRIVSPMPIEMRAGTVIDYRIRLAGVPVRWRSLISAWEPPWRFVDEQLIGPYGAWVHEHRFEPVAGGTRMDDLVRYAMPRLPLAGLVHPLVRRRLDSIFRYREAAMRRLLLPEGVAA